MATEPWTLDWVRQHCDAMDQKVLRYYEKDFDEHQRLRIDSIELLRTRELILRYLLDRPLVILDVGGATGVYSFWLSERGHEVHLVDACERHVAQATDISASSIRPLKSMIVADGRSVPFADKTFDAVLVLGPLYHLTNRKDRLAALLEAHRVMRPGAVVFCAAISRYAAMIDGMLHNYAKDPDYVAVMTRDITEGQHRDIRNKGYFTTAYCHLPEDLESEMKECGFAVDGVFAVESISEMIPDLERRMKDDRFRTVLLETIRLIEQDRGIMGMTAHLLGVGKKV